MKSFLHSALLVLGFVCPVWAADASLKCGTCHPAVQHTQAATPMAHALSLSTYAGSPRPMQFQRDGYNYRIEVRNGTPVYSVTDGRQTMEAPIRWTFGAKSQTYVLEHNGALYEGLVSYFQPVNGLDVTIGDEAIHPTAIEQAFGRRLLTEDAQACFECHSSGAHVSGTTVATGGLTPGVTCVRCHSDAMQHQAEALKGKLLHVPAKLDQQSPERISETCGTCHRTWETVMRMHVRGPNGVRFQPFRLANSKCYDGGDRRLSCISCHNPHNPALPTAAEVDRTCLGCHATHAQDTARVCPIGKENCASCHMPQVELPGGHRTFTDHQIRVARAGDPYPN